MNKPKNLHPPNKAKERKCVNSVLGKLICIHVQYANKIARKRARARKHTHAPYVNEPKSIISHLILYLKHLYVPHTQKKRFFVSAAAAVADDDVYLVVCLIVSFFIFARLPIFLAPNLNAAVVVIIDAFPSAAFPLHFQVGCFE